MRVLIAEDHTILRDGLKALLASTPDLVVAGEAEDGLQAIRRAAELEPDLVLMDLSMPRMNGMEAIREIRKQVPRTRVLVLTVHRTEEYVLAALQAGAEGYILKDATQEELMTAMRTVAAGRRWLSPDISQTVIDGYLEGRKGAKGSDSAWDSLTAREKEVLKLIAEGYRNKEIADLLCISLKTVEKHRDNLIKKLDLHNVAALTAYAIERGLISG